MITVFISYTLDPYKLDAFERYARNWLEIIPKCGGDLNGYFMPAEGTNDTAFALVTFPNLAEYEAYRGRIKADPAGAENFATAASERFILRERRTFLRPVTRL